MDGQPQNPTVLDYSRELAPPRFVRRLLRPIGWPYFSLLTVAALWSLWDARIPGAAGVFLGSFLFMGGFAALRGIVQGILARIYKHRWPGYVPGFWRYGVAAAVGVVLFTLLLCQVPVRIGFRLSEPALRREAETILAAQASAPPGSWRPVSYPPHRVGLYDMSDITCFPTFDSVRFIVAGSGFIDTDEGWAYCPLGPPSAAQNNLWSPGVRGHLEGPWYSVVLGF